MADRTFTASEANSALARVLASRLATAERAAAQGQGDRGRGPGRKRLASGRGE